MTLTHKLMNHFRKTPSTSKSREREGAIPKHSRSRETVTPRTAPRSRPQSRSKHDENELKRKQSDNEALIKDLLLRVHPESKYKTLQTQISQIWHYSSKSF